jgi:hypothetical protein
MPKINILKVLNLWNPKYGSINLKTDEEKY